MTQKPVLRETPNIDMEIKIQRQNTAELKTRLGGYEAARIPVG